MDFDDFWKLVEPRGRVARYCKDECIALWKKYSPEQQQAIYDAIETKINTGKFVSYRPNEAILDNVPKAPKIQTITADEYYRRYGTQTNQDGWERKFLPEEQRTIYVKN